MVISGSFVEWGETPSQPPAAVPVARDVPRRGLLVTALASLLAHVSPSRAEGQLRTPIFVAVYGDSQAEGLSVALLAATRGGGRFHVANRTKAGSALGQPVAYDWIAAVRRSIAADHPAIAVMMFGGNDRVPVHPPDGRALPFRSDDWLTYYRQRLQTLISTLTDTGTLIVWCGDPNTRDSHYAADMSYLNGLYRDALPASDATYVDIWDVAAGLDGGYASHGPGTEGVVQRLRTDDGIHFTAAGYGLVAQRVLRAMDEVEARKSAPAPDEPTTGARAGPIQGRTGADLRVEQPQPEAPARAADASHGGS
jgi:hypothetical protein